MTVPTQEELEAKYLRYAEEDIEQMLREQPWHHRFIFWLDDTIKAFRRWMNTP